MAGVQGHQHLISYMQDICAVNLFIYGTYLPNLHGSSFYFCYFVRFPSCLEQNYIAHHFVEICVLLPLVISQS